MRNTNLCDSWIHGLDTAVRTLWGRSHAQRSFPTSNEDLQPMTPAQTQLAGALMRVNHVGEVCAQALYQAQALTTKTPKIRNFFEEAAREERDHLAWTQQRLYDLGAHPSRLNPLWYAGAFGLGWIAGKCGDAVSLGFARETEQQVEAHLASHLSRLPTQDVASRAVVNQMKADETAHSVQAQTLGASPLPSPIRALMRFSARIMTTTAHWV